MTSSTTIPRIRRTAQNTQFTYNLSRRINDVQTYPVQSPQGATILIYGHDNGVTLVWRGGRRLKSTKKEPPKEKQNGTVDDSVMIIDSDDEEPPTKPTQVEKFVDKPQFEEATEQGPYPEIVQTLDLTLGTAVLNVAVPPVTPCAADEATIGGTTFLTEHIAFAVSCVTNDVYTITVPLTPPSSESKARPELRNDLLAGRAGSGAWGESLILLSGQTKPSKGVAINLVMPKPGERSQGSARAVVASHSWEASGVLRLWDVPLEATEKPDRAIEPFQTEFLPAPLGAISFNPIQSTQLLTVSPSQGVRIYEFAQSSFPPDPDATGPFPPQGSWLLTLYQPFTRQSSSRKPILDAAWIAHGRAVFALLADGTWGIWDVHGASPSSETSISTKLISGVRGAAITAFSVSGYIDGTSSLRSVVTQHKTSNSGDFAPMTPHTRRQVTASLNSTSTINRLAAIQGGVKVMALPSSGKALQDECIALWIGSLEHICVIPGVSRFWDSQLRKGAGAGGSLFTGSQPSRIIKLLDLSTGLLGDRCCGVRLVLNPSKAHDKNQDDGLPVDVLVQGESRFVVVREGEESLGKKIGGVVGSRRNRLFSSGDKTPAIIVHGKSDKDANVTFNLSTVKPGTLRKKSFQLGNEQDAQDPFGKHDEQLPLPRSQTGFEFASTLNAAADVSDDLTRRDVEAEMLDIMEIDQALEAINGRRDNGRKRVFFEDG